MAGDELKIQILRKSMSTFGAWLDSCDKLLASIPSELQHCNSPGLRELALKYKDLLLQLKEQGLYMQEIHSLSKEVTSTDPPKHQDITRDVRDLNKRFAKTCLEAKQYYSKLSDSLASLIAEQETVRSVHLVTPSPQHQTKSENCSEADGCSEAANGVEKRTSGASKTGLELDCGRQNEGEKFEIISLERSPVIGRKDFNSIWEVLGGGGGGEGGGGGGGGKKEWDEGKMSHGQPDVSVMDRESASNTTPQDITSETVDGPTPNPHPIAMVTPSDLNSKGEKTRQKATKVAPPPKPPKSSKSSKPLISPKSSLRKKVLTERAKAAAKKAKTVFETDGQLESCSDAVSSFPTSPSLHSLQNRIIAATDATSLDNTESLQQLSTTAPVNVGAENGFLEAPTRCTDPSLPDISGDSELNTSSLLQREKKDERQKFEVGMEASSVRSLEPQEMLEGRKGVRVEDGRERGGSTVDLSARLKDMSGKIQGFVHSIAEHRKCGLQSLSLELHLGEMKAMLTLLEVQELELVCLRATFSPSAQRRLMEERVKHKGKSIEQQFPVYPNHEISTNRDEILKLTERVEVLHKHCSDTVSQTDEVLEFVMQYEGEVKNLMDFLTGVRESVTMVTTGESTCFDTNWTKLREALTAVNEHKLRLSSIEQLSTHLLYLEPIFDGDPVREELHVLSEVYQSLVLEIFALLEEQARSRTEQLLLEVSVMSSWATEAELSLQVLTKKMKKPNGMTTKLAATRESLIKELEKRKSSLLAVSEKLQPITAVLSPDQHESLRDLLVQVEKNTQALQKIENGLKAIKIGLNSHTEPTSTSAKPLLQFLQPPPHQNGLKQSGQPAPRGPKSSGHHHPVAVSALYATVDEAREMMALPSPLVEYEQLPSEALDLAIAKLPHPPSPSSHHHNPRPSSSASSSPSHTRRKNRYATVDLYDHPRPFGRVALHEKLLEFISQEWASILTQTSVDEPALQEAIGCLDNSELRSSCQRFILSLRSLERNLRGVAEHISLVKVPQGLDLDRVHSNIDQCKNLSGQLKTLHSTLNHHNDESLTLLSLLGNRPPGSRVSQLLEIRLFDASTFWHSANLQVASRLRGLREKESGINSLHRRLQTITRKLEEAKVLLEEKQKVSNVASYLSKCREMHQSLLSFTDERDVVSAEIRENIRPQSPGAVSQTLLDELNQVNGQWPSVLKNLSEMSIVEPLLTKHMLANVAMELGAMESALPELRKRGLKLEEVEEKWRKCQAYLPKARELQSSLTCTRSRLHVLKPVFSGLDQQKEHLTNGDVNVTQLRQPMIHNRVSSPVQNGVVSTQNGVSMNQNGVSGSENKVYVEMVITSGGPELASINYEQLEQSCETSIQLAVWLASQLEVLGSLLETDRTLLSKFYQELRDLLLWTRDTRELLTLEGNTQTAMLRGKYQAICQQVVTRQPKLESLQSLAAEVLLLPCDGTEREGVEKKLATLYSDWDEICTQCVPAGVLPLVSAPSTQTSTNLQAPHEFEDVMQMTEWLILVESKLQPERITVGDFTQMRRLLRDLQSIERELKLKEKDYKRFMKEAIITSGSSIQSNSASSDPDSNMPKPPHGQVPILMIDSKCVKFSDENTLEREQRRKEITVETHPETTNGLELLEIEGASDVSWKYAVHSDTELGQQPFGLEHGRNQRASSSSSVQYSSPSSPIPDELYQLSVLWNGIWTILTQRLQGLESAQDMWRAFESRKEAFCGFLTNAEERVSSFFKVLSTAQDLSVMQAEVVAQKNFTTEVQSCEQKLATLNDLSHTLITHHHSNDDTSDLQDTMNDLNARWKRVMENYSTNQPTIHAVCSRWSEFYQQYQSLQQWLRTMDTEMSNLNPFVNDMAAVRLQLEKQKEIQMELTMRDGVVDAMRLQAHKLLQGVGGRHINATSIHAKLDNLGRRWDHLQKLAQERKSALEQALSEKQDLLSQVASCLTWLNQAEKHLSSQKPLGPDYYAVHAQYTAHQSFQLEVREQKAKLEAVILAGKQVAMETQWPPDTPERAAMDSLRAQYGALEERWKVLSREAEEWGQLVEKVLPEMEKFQALCSGCGQKLSEVEMRAAKFDPVAKKMHLLNQQLEALQAFESTLLSLGSILESMVVSQKQQVQMGVRISPDLLHLVKSYHQRWTDLQSKVTNRHAAIKRAMVKNNPVNLGFASLPRGWHRAKTQKGIPYYINTNTGNKTQWHHPDLSVVYEQHRAFDIHPFYPSSAYPIALKLRAVQKRTQLHLLQTRHAMEAFEEYHCYGNPEQSLTCPNMTALAVGMFQHVQEEEETTTTSDKLDLCRAVELTTCWLRDVYDVTHVGSISTLSFQLAAICMSQGKLEGKYRSLFNVISGNKSAIDLNQLTQFLEQVIQVPQSVCETQFCSLHSADVCARDCFKKFVGAGSLQLPQFIAWLQTEPQPLSWLPVLQRVIASEVAQHDTKCGVCRITPIVGFRYRCLQCKDFDMCQECYWSGKTRRGHDRSSHFVEEYCVSKSPGEDVKMFLKSLQRSFRKKKKQPIEDDRTGPLSPTQVGGIDPGPPATPLSPSWERRNSRGSPPAKKRHSTLCTINIGDSLLKTGSHGDDNVSPSHHRFTIANEVTPQPHRGSRPRLPSPPPLRRTTAPGHPAVPPRVPPKPARRRPQLQREGENGPKDVDTSLSKLSVENIHLSERLQNLRDHHSSSSPPSISPPAEGEQPSPEQLLKARTTLLQGRVQQLQDHNTRLQACISQLRAMTTLQQADGTTMVNLPPPPPLLLNEHTPVMKTGRLNL